MPGDCRGGAAHVIDCAALPDMTILSIDTSTPHGSVALLVDGELRLDETFTADRSHSASLFVVLEKARALVEQIDQVAVGLGPGSFAGVRIAIAAAIGLELSLGAKLVGIPSVAALEIAEPAYMVDRRRAAGDVLFHASRGGQSVSKVRCSQRKRNCATLLISLGGAAGLRDGRTSGSSAAQIALPSAAILARLAAEGRGIVARPAILNRSTSANRTSRSRKRGSALAAVFDLARSGAGCRRSDRSAGSEC